MHITRDRFLLIVLLTAALGLAAGVAIRSGTLSDVFASSEDGGGAPDGVSSELRLVRDLQPDDMATRAITWAGDRDVWYVSTIDGDLTLSRTSVDTGETTSHLLPVRGASSPFTYLVEDSDGLLWVASAYALIAFDPDAGQVVWSTRLEPANDYATDDALEPGNPSPGTWINGFVSSTDGSLVMTRNNVAATFHVSRDGVTLAEALSDPADGLQSVGGEAIPYARRGALVERLGQQGSPELVPLTWASSETCSIATDPEGSAVTGTLQSRVTFRIPATPHPLDMARIAGPFAAIGLAGQGAVIVVNCETGDARQLSLGSIYAFPDGPGMLLGGEPESVATEVEHVHRPAALALSPSGAVAIVTDQWRLLVSP